MDSVLQSSHKEIHAARGLGGDHIIIMCCQYNSPHIHYTNTIQHFCLRSKMKFYALKAGCHHHSPYVGAVSPSCHSMAGLPNQVNRIPSAQLSTIVKHKPCLNCQLSATQQMGVSTICHNLELCFNTACSLPL